MFELVNANNDEDDVLLEGCHRLLAETHRKHVLDVRHDGPYPVILSFNLSREKLLSSREEARLSWTGRARKAGSTSLDDLYFLGGGVDRDRHEVAAVCLCDAEEVFAEPWRGEAPGHGEDWRRRGVGGRDSGRPRSSRPNASCATKRAPITPARALV